MALKRLFVVQETDLGDEMKERKRKKERYNFQVTVGANFCTM